MNFLVQEWKRLSWRRWVVVYCLLAAIVWAGTYGELFFYAALTTGIGLVAGYLWLRFYLSQGYTVYEIMVDILAVYSWPFHGGLAQLNVASCKEIDEDEPDNKDDFSEIGFCLTEEAANRLDLFVSDVEPDVIMGDDMVWRYGDFFIAARRVDGRDGDYDCVVTVNNGLGGFEFTAVYTMRITWLHDGVFMQGRFEVERANDSPSNTTLIPSQTTCRRLPGVYVPEQDVYASALMSCLDGVTHRKRTR
ncbi:MAG: hypothetical protein WAS27_04510 [Candidatus Saccharimonadales bacterium]